MKLDKYKSLAELTGEDWGDVPLGANLLIRERYQFRRSALKDLSVEAIDRLIELDYKQDSRYLIPFALNALNGSWNYTESMYFGLLIRVMMCTSYSWRYTSDDLKQIRTICDKWIYELDNMLSDAECTSDSNQYFKQGFDILMSQNRILEALVNLERRVTYE